MAAPADDPWAELGWDQLPVLRGVRVRYAGQADPADPHARAQWRRDAVLVKIEPTSFASGNMRLCFRMRLACVDAAASESDAAQAEAYARAERLTNWAQQANYVSKRYSSPRDEATYDNDVTMQMYAKSLALEYNKLGPPRLIDFLEAFTVLVDDASLADVPPEWRFHPDVERSLNGGKIRFHCEAFVPGEYRKHSNNAGVVGCFAVNNASDSAESYIRNTPQAFSHFTYEFTRGKCIVVDIQGVGDLLTDPQIHSTGAPGEFGKGNLGLRGMAMFFESHLCTKLCQQLKLKLFQLSHEEVHALRSERQRSTGATVLSPNTPRRESTWLRERKDAERWDRFTEQSSGLGMLENMPQQFPDVPESQEATLHYIIANLKKEFRLSFFHLLVAADMGSVDARAAVLRLKDHYKLMRARRGADLTTQEFLDSLNIAAKPASARDWTLVSERSALLVVSAALVAALFWMWRTRRRT